MGLSWDDKMDFTITGYTLPRNIIVCFWVNVVVIPYIHVEYQKKSQLDFYLVAVEDRVAAGRN